MRPSWQLLLMAAALPLAACSDQARHGPDAARDSASNPVVSQAPEAGTDSAQLPTFARGWAVDFDGVGPLRIGMTEQQARAALSAGLDWPAGPAEGCDYAFVQGIGGGLGLMVSDGRIARVDVNAPSIPTAAGARVGDLRARIQRLYGPGVQVEPHKYEDGHYLIVSAPDTARRLIFETRGDTVTMFRAGRRPEVDWVEGCS